MAAVAGLIITGVMTGVSMMRQRSFGKKLASAQQQQAQFDKEAVDERAELDLQAQREQNRRDLSTRRAQLATTGFDITSGSLLENLIDTRTNLEINALRQRRGEGLRAKQIGAVGQSRAATTRGQTQAGMLQTLSRGVGTTTNLLLR